MEKTERRATNTVVSKKVLVAIGSWLPAIGAAVIAVMTILSIQRNQVELAKATERLAVTKEQLKNAEAKRDGLEKERAQLATEIGDEKAKLSQIQETIAAVRSNPSAARELLGEVSAIASGAAEFWKNGKEAEKRGEQEVARQNYEKAIAVDPGFIKAYLSLGKLYEGQRNATAADLQAAADLYQKAALRNPINADVFENLGLLEIRRGNWPELVHVCLKLKKIRLGSDVINRIWETLQAKDPGLACEVKLIPLAQYFKGLDAENAGARDEAIKLYTAACLSGEKRACYMRDKLERLLERK